ncbi:PAAR domain-containing protein [Ralstonia sp. UBA689]|uniref:PAAR domain-containing protein n=1 Tax=Ralstonia sp. UBA689 TaxID=1947373 RepID=UPI0025EBCC77|nr:PAAR domain-containing protein [Ralstonia sp. UBA689]
MRRNLIRVGDKTTAGGTVVDGDHTCTHHGIALSYNGALIICPACKSTGRACNVPPMREITFQGKQALLENDICLCKCNPPPRLIASQNTMYISFDGDELTGMGLRANVDPLPEVTNSEQSDIFDEQFMLVNDSGFPMANMYYTIKPPSGELQYGVTDHSGKTQRFRTDFSKRIAIYIGHRDKF